MRMLSPEYQHKNQKRNLFQLFTDDIKQVNFYEAKKGAILGNHYHKETKEYFYITRGTVLLKTNQGKELAQRIVNKGEFFLVEPLENHIVEVLSPDMTMLTFLSKPYTKENPDIHIYKGEKDAKKTD